MDSTLNNLSFDEWSCVTCYFKNPKTVFNCMMVSKDILEMFHLEHGVICENVNFSLWPFESRDGDLRSLLSNGISFPYVHCLSIGPMDRLQRLLAFKKRKKEEGELVVFKGEQEYDERLLMLIFKKFSQLRKLRISVYYEKYLRIRSTIFNESNINELSITHPDCIIDREVMFHNLPKVPFLRSLKLFRWKSRFNEIGSSNIEENEDQSEVYVLQDDLLSKLEGLEIDCDFALSRKESQESPTLYNLRNLKIKRRFGKDGYGNPRKENNLSDFMTLLDMSSRTLEILSLEDEDMEEGNGEDFIDDSFNLINFEKLKEISFSNFNLINGTMFIPLKNTITKLSIHKCRNIKGSFFLGANVLNKLQDLSISECIQFGNFGSVFFQAYSHLRRLSLTKCLDILGKESFLDYEDLEYFSMINCTNEGLNEECVEMLFENNPKLSYIQINECNPMICGPKDEFSEFEYCTKLGCHSVITRSMMSSQELENRPKKVRCYFWQWHLPQIRHEYWPYMECDTHSTTNFFCRYVKCPFCGEKLCCGSTRRCYVRKCTSLVCPKCSVNCRYCEKSIYRYKISCCSVMCVLYHEKYCCHRPKKKRNSLDSNIVPSYKKLKDDFKKNWNPKLWKIMNE